MREVIKLSDNTRQYFDNYFAILDEMELAMQEVNATDSISETYIMQMLPHHEAGIKMSENILSFTTNPEVELITKNIISNQENSLSSLLGTCENIPNTERDNGLYLSRFRMVFDGMVRRMRNIESNNNLNRAYLLSMLAYHEGGIELTKNLLRYDICPELKEYAQRYIVSETLQTQAIRNLLRRQNI